MTQTHKITFYIITGLLFLLPIFFIPGGALFLNGAKASLLSLGAIVAVLVFVWESSRVGKLSLPWHYFLGAVLLLPLVYLVSALFSTPSSMALFGYELEVGTFAYIAVASVLLFLIALVYTDKSRVLWGIMAVFASLLIVAVFAVVRILTGGDFLNMGVFSGNMGNPLGRWTDLAVGAGLLAVLTIPAIHMTSVKNGLRILLYVVFALATLLMAVIHFTLAFGLALASSIFLFVYFSTIESQFLKGASDKEKKGRYTLPIILGIVSLLFLLNPVVTPSGVPLGDTVSGIFKVENTDVRPSFASTLNIAGSVLREHPVLGSGPNTFGQDWLAYKSGDINTTLFWNVSFPFGIGFVPTQIATTGALGTIFWIAFFVLFALLGKNALANMPESRSLRFVLVSSFLAAFFLWAGSFFYAPSISLLTLAFASSGLFVASARLSEALPVYKLNFKEVPTASFVATLLAVVLASGSFVFGFSVFQKTASAYYYKKAVDLSAMEGTSVEAVENSLIKAISYSSADIHYTALAQLNFSKAQAIATNEAGDPEENRAKFEEALSRSIAAAQAAVEANPSSYQNWITLGSIYAALVPEPLSVEGSYENALAAYREAGKRNPASPEVPLLIARLELSRGEIEAARTHIQESLALKPDYADAYFALAQLEMGQNNIEEAIASAETGTLLSPANPGLYFEVGLLKYSNEDYEGARESFSQALELVPDYANAKYYLGLSLAQLGNSSEALVIFEELAVTNPESQEVALILENLREGRPALEGVPDSASSVEERTSPPLSETSE